MSVTIKALLDTVIEQAQRQARENTMPAAREFALAATAAEDAQMRYTRGLAKAQGQFNPADLEA